MKQLLAIILLVLMTFSCISSQYSPSSRQIHDGAGSFIFTDIRGNPNKPIPVWYFQPSGFSHQNKVLFVLHDVKRDARNYRDEWIQYAQRYGFLLVVPEFSRKYYPGKREYNEGNIFDNMENPIPENDTAFMVIEHLFDHIKEVTGNQSSAYDIYGHSAGGQFVQRMILFRSDSRIRTAIAANPGIYAMASYSEKYPYGIGNSGVTPEDLRKAFKRNFILLLGEKDVIEDDPNLGRSPEALAQGNSRFERGLHFYDSAKNEATRLGMIFNWEMASVPGAAHHDAQLAQTAARFFFIQGSD